ncbi:Uncharacterised protein [Elizabethkingia meningoseptica]|nr:Uncharacterised protein [Elizabethkingia meningoseptica]
MDTKTIFSVFFVYKTTFTIFIKLIMKIEKGMCKKIPFLSVNSHYIFFYD